jgi:ABC-type multidrug transport system fused ATPase/permease subunit
VSVYAFLHLSLVDLYLTASGKLSERFTCATGAHPSIAALAKWTFGCGYVLSGLLLNVTVWTVLVDLVLADSVLGSSPFLSLLLRALCSCLFVISYTLFISLLSLVVRRTDFLLATALLSHVAAIQCIYSSFMAAYNEPRFSLGAAPAFVFPPFTALQLYCTLLSGETVSLYLVAAFLQIAAMGTALATLPLLDANRPSRHVQLRDYENIHNEPIDSEREYLENLEDRSGLPLAGDNLVHRYSARPVLRNFSFHLEAGEVLGLLGHNGSGKSTVIRAVSGQIDQSSGTVTVLSSDKGAMGFR